MNAKYIAHLLLTVCFGFSSVAHDTAYPIAGSPASAKNIVSFSPLNFIVVRDHFFESKPRAAVTFSYECLFMNEGLGVKFPLSILPAKPGLYLAPAVKFYPEKQGLFKYAIGPQFIFSYIMDNTPSYLNVVGGDHYEMRKQFGIGISSAVNLSLSNSLSIAADAGLGILFYDSFYYNYKKEFGNPAGKFTDLNLRQAINLALNLGYRF